MSRVHTFKIYYHVRNITCNLHVIKKCGLNSEITHSVLQVINNSFRAFLHITCMRGINKLQASGQLDASLNSLISSYPSASSQGYLENS